jgi:hypothetical protein
MTATEPVSPCFRAFRLRRRAFVAVAIEPLRVSPVPASIPNVGEI